MKVSNLVEMLNLKVFSGHAGLDGEITNGYTSDLLSDVMGNASEGAIWVTLQTHKNIMAIASLKELSAVVLVKGYTPDEATLEQSNAENIPILGTSLSAFDITGLIYNQLKA